ncbi:MAG: hypothetical protein ACREPB_02430, partial [Arenimonas sp.]
MVAVVSGNGLGLFNTSLTALGGLQGGPAGLGGRAGSQVVNIANGNLILQDQDENLSVRGFNSSFLRTYNSRGTVAGMGQDGFVTGYERKVALTSGSLNVAGSQMTLSTGDGQTQVFTYSSANTYTSTDGEGAHDTLVWSSGSSTWTMTEGSSRREEQYANHADSGLLGRLIRIRDLKSDGTASAQFDVLYSDNTASARIVEIRSIDDQVTATLRDAILFSYDGSNRLISITTREGGATKNQVSYVYDGQNRLLEVIQDLTPSDVTGAWSGTASANDGYRFRTAYTYVTTTASDLRIASVSQSDGATVAYTYEADGVGGFRVKTVTQGSSSDGSAQTVTFTYNTNSTDVTDGLNRTWTYQYDANKQLTAILAPTVSGQRDTTTYTYDASGNVTQVKTVSGATTLSQTDQSFDANGNVLWQWTRVDGANASSMAVQRTYSSTNQLLIETRYTGLDADGPVATQSPTGGVTTNFIYDAQNRLRFTVDATGAVTEKTYATTGDGIGQVASSRTYFGAVYASTMTESALNTWATTTQKASSQLTEFTYDVKGRLQQSVSFASVNASGVGVTTDVANDITSYSYDAQGLLLQKITVRGTARTTTYTATPPTGSEVSSYVYDGMGRLLTVLKRDIASSAGSDALTVSTTYAYADSAQQIVVTLDSGATQLQTLNKAGQTTAVAQAGSGQTTRTTQNFFDTAGQLRGSQDASGARRYFFYDNKGRLDAEVDATGAVTKYHYDGADRRVSSVQYANRVTTTTWLTGSTVNKALFADIGVVADGANDRTSVNTFDAVGRLLTSTDAAGGTERQITTYTYDGAGRLTLISTTDSVGTAATARVTRQFYDNAGRLVATLDAERYLVRTTYDSAGRVIQTTRSAGKIVTPATIDATTLLSSLTIPVDATNDQTTRYFYNGRGQQIGTLDALGYLTEAIVDEAGNTRAERRYAKQLTGLTGTEIFSALKTLATTAAPTEAYRESKSAYNGLGQLVTQTNYEGSVTKFTYDDAGRLVRTQSAEDTSEVREGFKRYNVFDELIGEISGQQVQDLADQKLMPWNGKLLNDVTLTETELNAAYNAYGVTHSYDAMSRRIESRDAAGNKTFYFYDSEGNQIFVVKGVAQDNAGITGVQNSYGEVTETRYNAFGQVVQSMAYTGRIQIPVPGDRASIESTISTFKAVTDFTANTIDTRRQFVYDQRGLLKESIDALNKKTTYSYTAFGQLNQEIRTVGDSATSVTIQHNYDKRGLETSRTDGVGTSIARTSSQTYDAFGRAISSTDARGGATSFTYDRLGRQITRSLNVTAEGVSRTETMATMAYDAFSQMVSLTDALNNTTTYQYSDFHRRLIVTSPEGVIVTTIHNRFGQTVTVTDGNNATTSYAYDKNGFMVSSTNALNQTTHYTPDVRSMLYESTDATGRKVRYSYDAVGRVLTRSDDPTGLNLITTTSYDGQGRQVKVTDASGRITTMSYDQEGRLLQTAQDPSGLNLRTSYSYDAAGRQVTVTEGSGTSNSTTTQYNYDVFGRRDSEIIDPGIGHLILSTGYLYDANDNVVQRTDATGNVSRFVYDEADRLTHEIDPNGGVTKTTYDKDGRVVAVRSYATAITVSDLSSTAGASAATIKARVDVVANEAIDQISYRVYDGDSRVRFSVTHLTSTTASVTETRYDTVGRVSQTNAYTSAITLSAPLKSALQTGNATALTDIKNWSLAPVSTTWMSGFDGNSLAGFNNNTWVFPSVVNGAVVFERNPGVSTGVAPIIVSDTRPYLADGHTYSSEIRVGGSLAGSYFAMGVQNEAEYLSAPFLRDAIIIENGVLQRFQITGAVESKTALMTLSLDTTYVVETETAGDHITTFVYVKGSDRNSGVSYSRQIDSATYGKTLWYAHGLKQPGVTGGTVYLDNVSATKRQIAQIQTNRYDLVGRLILTLDALGNETKYGYDAAGRRSSVTDARGFTSYVVYDGAGRAKYSIDALGTVSESVLDASGRIVAKRTYANAINLNSAVLISKISVGIATSADLGISVDVVRDHVTYIAYDNAGRARYEINALGAVTENDFDANGRITAVRRYANVINLGAAGLTSKLLSGTATTSDLGIIADTSRDQAAYMVYDAAGRMRFDVDAQGNITEKRYDASGQVTQALEYAAPISLSGADITGLLNGSMLASTLAARVSAQETSARVSYQVFDAAGRIIYKLVRIDATHVTVHQLQYDANGQMLSEIRYAKTIEYTPSHTASEIAVAISDVTFDLPENQRLTQRVFDVAGRLRFMLDDQGTVVEYRYDAIGQLTDTLQYLYPIGAGSQTEAELTAILSLETAYRKASMTYDAAGHLISSTDALNQVEYYAYNATGDRVRFTNKLGNTWTYDYDATGRQTEERSPAIVVAYYDASGLQTRSQVIATRTVYDAFGNVISRTENASAPLDEQRTTSYVYDTAGRRIKTIYPDAYRWDIATNAMVANGSLPSEEVIYNALGQAIVNKDVRGNYSYKVYDNLGRLAYDVD